MSVVLCLAVGPACSHTTAHLRLAPGMAPPSDAPPTYRLVLIGDAGEPKTPEPVLQVAASWAREFPARTRVLLLGDNAYPKGVAAGQEREAKRRLDRQIEELAPAGTPILFVPGNHDWEKGGRRGIDVLRAQAAHVTRPGVELRPTAGCPGPWSVDLPSDRPVVRVVVLDTQWWLHKHSKGVGCKPNDEGGVVADLEDALRTDLPVVVAAHHPLATHGPHGGFSDWRDWLFPLVAVHRSLWIPLPGVGPLVRHGFVKNDQDLSGARNRRMVQRLNDALRARRNALTVFAAGHEHSLQVLTGVGADYVLVSGAGSSRHTTPVGTGRDSLFALERSGFMVLDVLAEGVRLSVVDARSQTDTRLTRFMLPKRN